MPTEPEVQAASTATPADNTAEASDEAVAAAMRAPDGSKYATMLAAWLTKEQMAHCLLMQKLPDSISCWGPLT
jgi:hypothetical protein